MAQDGFDSKITLVDHVQSNGQCIVHTVIHWNSRQQWQNISAAAMHQVDLAFIKASTTFVPHHQHAQCLATCRHTVMDSRVLCKGV